MGAQDSSFVVQYCRYLWMDCLVTASYPGALCAYSTVIYTEISQQNSERAGVLGEVLKSGKAPGRK